MGSFDFLVSPKQEKFFPEHGERETFSIKRAKQESFQQGESLKGLKADRQRAIEVARNALNLVGHVGREKTISGFLVKPLRPETSQRAITITRTLQGDIEGISNEALVDDLELLSKAPDLNDTERKGLVDAIAAFRRASESETRIPEIAARPVPELSQDAIASEKGRLETLQEEREKAKQDLNRFGITNPARKIQLHKITELGKQIEGLKRDISIFAAPSPPTTVPQTGEENPNTDIKKQVATANSAHEDFVSSIPDLGRENGVRDLYGTSSMPTATRMVLQSLQANDPDLFQEWVSELQLPEAKEFLPPAGGTPGAKAQRLETMDREIDALRAQRKAMYARIGTAPEMQSWYAVLALFALSYLVGAKGALQVFYGAIQNGTLKYQLDELRDDILRMERQREREDERKRDFRRFASMQLTRAQEREEEKEEQWERAVHLAVRQDALAASRSDKDLANKLFREYSMADRAVKDARANLLALSDPLKDVFGLSGEKKAELKAEYVKEMKTNKDKRESIRKMLITLSKTKELFEADVERKE